MLGCVRRIALCIIVHKDSVVGGGRGPPREAVTLVCAGLSAEACSARGGLPFAGPFTATTTSAQGTESWAGWVDGGGGHKWCRMGVAG